MVLVLVCVETILIVSRTVWVLYWTSLTVTVTVSGLLLLSLPRGAAMAGAAAAKRARAETVENFIFAVERDVS